MFFPGGSIGDLAVNGTVNDLAMAGARPLVLSTAFILEEGTALADLGPGRAGAWARPRWRPGCGWSPATPRSSTPATATASTSTPPGIGVVADGVDIRPQRAAPGDVVIVSGDIGVHGVAVMSCREGLGVRHRPSPATPPRCTGWSPPCSTPARTCTCCATRPAAGSPRRSTRSRPRVRRRRRPGRAGPADPARRSRDACGLLGLDPLYVANEGKLVAFVPPADAERGAGGDAGAPARARRGRP